MSENKSVRPYNPPPLWDTCATIGLLAYMAGLSLPHWMDVDQFRWVVAAGAVVLLVARLFAPYHGGDLRLRRLVRIQVWAAIFLCAAAVFLFVPGGTMRDFLAFTLAGAALQIFTSIAIPLRGRKILKGQS